MSSSASTACGFSILAMTGMRLPISSMISSDILDVLGRTHEGQGDEVGILLDTPAQVLLVLFRQGGHGHGDAGQVQALVIGDNTRDLDEGHDIGLVHLKDADRDVAVVDQQAVAGGAVTGQALESRTDEFLGAGNVAGGDG